MKEHLERVQKHTLNHCCTQSRSRFCSCILTCCLYRFLLEAIKYSQLAKRIQMLSTIPSSFQVVGLFWSLLLFQKHPLIHYKPFLRCFLPSSTCSYVTCCSCWNMWPQFYLNVVDSFHFPTQSAQGDQMSCFLILFCLCFLWRDKKLIKISVHRRHFK